MFAFVRYNEVERLHIVTKLKTVLQSMAALTLFTFGLGLGFSTSGVVVASFVDSCAEARARHATAEREKEHRDRGARAPVHTSVPISRTIASAAPERGASIHGGRPKKAISQIAYAQRTQARTQGDTHQRPIGTTQHGSAL